MPTTKRSDDKSAPGPSGARDVVAFIHALDHPRKEELRRVRSIIAGAHPAIAEGIKWNSPRFYFREWFATVTIRKDVVYVILHRGAKVRDNSTARPTIDDPTGLLNWFANDRAVVRFSDMQ